MCRFFKDEKKVFRGAAATFILMPLVFAIAYHTNREALACSCLWFVSAVGSVAAGYGIKVPKKCQLPHVAENIIVEPEQMREEFVQIEGDREELEVGIPQDLLPPVVPQAPLFLREEQPGREDSKQNRR